MERSRQQRFRGRAEMSLIETALCPLNAKDGIPLVHRSTFTYYDKNKHKQEATATVKAFEGLLPNDEVFLWALLAIGLSQESHRFYITRNYLLRMMGMVDPRTGKPRGEDYATFHRAIDRVANARYSCDKFWDPIRCEHREVNFGFVSYSKPLNDEKSGRAWEFGVDPILYRYLEPSKAYFSFDLRTIHYLDDATRRAFMLLKKIYGRKGGAKKSPVWSVEFFAVNVLGCSPTLPIKKMRDRVKRCAIALNEIGMVDISKGLLDGRGSKSVVVFHRGEYLDYDSPTAAAEKLENLPIYEQWQTIGVDRPGMEYLRRAFKKSLLSEWADITLCALEKWGKGYFEKSPAAYYIDNVKAAAGDTGRTFPDWWHEHRKQEFRKQMGYDKFERDEEVEKPEPSRAEFLDWLRTDGKKLYAETLETLFGNEAKGKVIDTSKVAGIQRIAQQHLWGRFVEERDAEDSGAQNFFCLN